MTHYNRDRPHRALALLPPEASYGADRPAAATIERHDLLGGLIHEYRDRSMNPHFETPHRNGEELPVKAA
jgi:hypothetical protein